MDFNEYKRGFAHRHPWEISRTNCAYKCWEKYMKNISSAVYLNIGAGDAYFDDKITRMYKCVAHAVDIAYTDDFISDRSDDRIVYYTNMNDIEDGMVYDYVVMMDSLEYMENDTAVLEFVYKKLKQGGILFLTLPMGKNIYSDFDRLVGNLRRYDEDDIEKITVNGLFSVVEKRSFYFSLKIVRKLELLLDKRFDELYKVTTGWQYKEDSFITRFLVKMLNLDFFISGIFKLKGLSWMLVLRKE